MKRCRILHCCVALTLLSWGWSAFAQSGNVRSAQNISALKKQAESGDANAQFRLGMDYASGQRVQQNCALAMEWYRKSADQGNADAQTELGATYAWNDIFSCNFHLGISPAYGKAAAWFRKAAEQGKDDAQNDLGLLYEDGNGVSQDYAGAYFWFCLASAKNPIFSKNRDRIAPYLTKAVLLETQEQARIWLEDHLAKTTSP